MHRCTRGRWASCIGGRSGDIGASIWIAQTRRASHLVFPAKKKDQGARNANEKDNGTAAAADAWEQEHEQHSGSIGDEPTRARHLLRSILRETTYLPDREARHWVKQHALHRFRKYTWFASKHRENVPPEFYRERLQSKEKEARRWVAFLRRANEGERKPLRRILFMTYGRVGYRRHALLEPLLRQPDPGESALLEPTTRDADEDGTEEDALPHTDEAVEEDTLEKTIHSPASSPTIDVQAVQRIRPQLTEPLRALLSSQIHVAPPELRRPNPRRITLLMPMYNSWLRKMPQKRVKNKLREHYSELVDRALPPLPIAEWEHLLALATGTEPVETPSPRRPLAYSVAAMDPGEAKNTALEAVLQFGKLPKRLVKESRRNRIQPRFMRRLYAEVLRQCPQMDWDPTTKRWHVRWGSQGLRAFESQVRAAKSLSTPSASGDDEQNRILTDGQG